jgi:hypothetical protein
MFKYLFAGVRAEREVVRRFRESAACSVDFARSFKEMGVSPSPALRKLQRRGVIRSAGTGSYFLDEREFLSQRLNRTKWGIMLLFLIVGLIMLLLVGGV